MDGQSQARTPGKVDGETRKLAPGDALIVSNGVPHRHASAEIEHTRQVFEVRIAGDDLGSLVLGRGVNNRIGHC